MSGREKVSFGYKRMNRPGNNLSSTPKAFRNYPDEQYEDFSRKNTPTNKKRLRE